MIAFDDGEKTFDVDPVRVAQIILAVFHKELALIVADSVNRAIRAAIGRVD